MGVGQLVHLSALIWIFLPYYLRGGLYTMPNSSSAATTRLPLHYAVCSLVSGSIAQMA